MGAGETMPDPPRYFSILPCRPRIRPSDPGYDACGVHLGRRDGPQVGIAFPIAYIGGAGLDSQPGETDGPPEIAWRLQVGKETLEDRFVLRDGEFVELAEDAE